MRNLWVAAEAKEVLRIGEVRDREEIKRSKDCLDRWRLVRGILGSRVEVPLAPDLHAQGRGQREGVAVQAHRISEIDGNGIGAMRVTDRAQAVSDFAEGLIPAYRLELSGKNGLRVDAP